MAELTCGAEERKLFLFLAEEELGHKHRVESLYEQTVYQDF